MIIQEINEAGGRIDYAEVRHEKSSLIYVYFGQIRTFE